MALDGGVGVVCFFIGTVGTMEVAIPSVLGRTFGII